MAGTDPSPLDGRSPAGLATAEAHRRRAEDGPNELPRPRRRPMALRFAAELVHFFALMLWVAAGLAWAAGLVQLTVAIGGVVVLNAVFSFIQEQRADRAAERLRVLLPSEVRVRRDGIAVAIVPLSLAGFDRIEAIQRFLSALHGRAIPPDTRLTRQQRARLRRMLRAFDGHRAGVTQQEIARVLLNTGRLERDEWQASSARHAIKALLRDARSMVAGGYRKLLRHRRPR